MLCFAAYGCNEGKMRVLQMEGSSQTAERIRRIRNGGYRSVGCSPRKAIKTSYRLARGVSPHSRPFFVRFGRTKSVFGNCVSRVAADVRSRISRQNRALLRLLTSAATIFQTRSKGVGC